MSPDLKHQLQSILGSAGWLEGDDVLARPASVARPGTLQTRYLARPDSTAQVSAVLKACHAAGQVVVPQGGISGLVRGADTQPDVLVLSTERMRRIEERHGISPDAAEAFAERMARIKREEIEAEPLLRGLGPEPLGNEFDAAMLAQACTGKKTSLKVPFSLSNPQQWTAGDFPLFFPSAHS